MDRDALGGLAVGIKEWTGAFLCISHNQEFVGALCPEIWNVEGGELTHKGKAAIVDEAFESNPASARATPAGTPGPGTPAASTPAESTPAGSGDEARANATIAGVEDTLNFKAAKGKKKVHFVTFLLLDSWSLGRLLAEVGVFVAALFDANLSSSSDR